MFPNETQVGSTSPGGSRGGGPGSGGLALYIGPGESTPLGGDPDYGHRQPTSLAAIQPTIRSPDTTLLRPDEYIQSSSERPSRNGPSKRLTHPPTVRSRRAILPTRWHKQAPYCSPSATTVRLLPAQGRIPHTSRRPLGKMFPEKDFPGSEADTYLLGLIRQAHGLWPGTPIYVIGHSEGGLVAEQLFEQHSLKELRLAGVARIFSLDSPINGLGFTPPAFVEVSPALAALYHLRWESRGALQLDLIKRDKADGLIYMPIGTVGDEVYNLADFSCRIESQVIWASGPAPIPR